MKPVRVLLLIFLAVLTVPGTGANPIPMPGSDGTPVPSDSPLAIIFRSEKVVYTVDREDVASVDALYGFQNSLNAPATLNISLPFYHDVPKDLGLAGNGRTVAFETVDSEYPRDPYYSFARFRLDFLACETVNLRAVYTIDYTVYSDWHDPFTLGTGQLSYQHFWCRYIAETGRYWNNSLDSATFQFRIKQDLYGSGLEGFTITRESGYVVATQAYSDWRPDQDIDARWQRPDIGMTLLAHWLPILVVVWVLSMVVVVVAFRQRRLRKQAMRAWRKP